ncbi:hypothetical protein V2E24_02215 [Mycoplasmopsis ciconiae]|uniref:Uncharacterized protein n=1 Tax=Mycoplasmopsis ciconiae TaxID=561067 RepID=A0ABU7MLK9_9BACT|nr:hypothetical protein [Mycoplasmopsis ciconiae]
MDRKTKKIAAIGIVSTSILAAGLGTFITFLNTNTTKKVSIPDNTIYEKLNLSNQKLSEISEKINDIDQQFKQEAFNLNQYAQSILQTQNDVQNAYELDRNINFLISKISLLDKLKSSDSQKQEEIQRFLDQIKDPEYILQAKELSKNSRVNLANNPTFENLQKFIADIQPVLDKSNDLYSNIYTKIWNIKQSISKNLSIYSKSGYSLDALAIVNNMYESLEKSTTISRDNLDVFDSVLNKLLNNLSSEIEQNIYKQNQKVKDQIILSLEKIKKVVENIPVAKDNSDVSFAIKTINNLTNEVNATNNLEKLNILKDYVLLVTNDFALINEPISKFEEKFNTKISEIQNLKVDDTLKNKVNEFLNNVKFEDFKNDPLNSLLLVSNLQTNLIYANNFVQQLNNSLEQNFISKNELDEFKNKLNEIDLSFDLSYIQKVEKLENDFQTLLKFAKQILTALDILKMQLSDHKSDFSSDFTNQYKKILEQINANNSNSYSELLVLMKQSSNEFIAVLKQELAKDIQVAQQFIDNPKTQKNTKGFLTLLNESSKKYLVDFYDPTRVELLDKVKQYNFALAQAKSDIQKNLFFEKSDSIINKINELFSDVDENTKNNITQKVKNLEAVFKAVAEDPQINYSQKENKFDELNSKLDTIDSNLESLANLAKTVKDAKDFLNTFDNDPESSNVFSDAINTIENLINQANNQLNNPDINNNIDSTNQNLSELVQETKKEKAKYDASNIYRIATRNNIWNFANLLEGNKTSNVLQDVIQKQLDDLNYIVENYKLDNQTRDEAKAKMEIINDQIPFLANLESNRQILTQTLNNVLAQKYGDFTPEKEINNASALLEETLNWYSSINANNFPTNEKISELEAKLVDAKEKLEYANYVALLNLEQQKYNNFSLDNFPNSSPYKDTKDAYENLNNLKEELLSANPKSTIEQIKDLIQKFTKEIPLAQQIKNNLEKLQQIEGTADSDNAYEKLKDVILNNLIDPSDSVGQIQNKITNLAKELSNTDLRIEDQKLLNILEQVFSTQDQQKAIFEDILDKNNEKINEFKETLAKDDNSVSSLLVLKSEILEQIKNAKNQKDSVQQLFDNTKEKIESSFEKLYKQATLSEIEPTPNLDKLSEQYNNISDLNSTNQKDLEDILFNISLAYKKDLFDNEAQKAKQSSQNNLQIQPLDLSSELNDNIQKVIEDITAKTNQTDSVIDVNEYVNEVIQLNKLAQKQRQMLERINTYSDDLIIVEKLTNALKENKPTNESNSSDIEQLSKNLDQVWKDVSDLQKYKDQEMKVIQRYLDSIDDTFSNSPQAAEEIKAEVEKLKDKLNNADSKNKVDEIDLELQSIINNESQIKALINQINEANAGIERVETSTTPVSEAQQNIIDEINKKINEASQLFTNTDYNTIVSKKDEIQSLLDKLETVTRVDAILENVLDNLRPINYILGNGGLIPQEHKQRFIDFVEKQRLILQGKNPSDLQQPKIIPTNESLILVQLLLERSKTLIASQMTSLQKIEEIQAQTISDSDILENGEPVSFNFEADAKNLADIVMLSVPNVDSTSEEILSLSEKLHEDFQKQLLIYTTRKDDINKWIQIYKEVDTDLSQENNNSDENSKYYLLSQNYKKYFALQKNLITDSNYSINLDPQNMYFFDDSTNVLEKLNKALNNVIVAKNSIDTQKQLADIISVAKQKNQEYAQMIQTAKSEDNDRRNIYVENDQFESQNNTLNSIIENAQKYLLINSSENVDSDTLSSLAQIIEQTNLTQVSINKTNLFYQWALERQKIIKISLDNDYQNTNIFENSVISGTAYLSENEKNQLLAILDQAIENLVDSNQSIEQNLNKFITSNGVFSVKTTINRSLELHNAITKAKTWIPDQNYLDTEDEEVRELFNKLKEFTQTAIDDNTSIDLTTNLKIDNTKLTDIYNINVTIQNIIDDKFKQVSKTLADAILLKQYIDTNYPESKYPQGSTPVVENFQKLAIDNIRLDSLNSLEAVKNIQNSLSVAKQKIKEQKTSLIKWETRKLIYAFNKLKPYALYYQNSNNTIENAKFNEIKRITGVSDETIAKNNELIANSEISDAINNLDNISEETLQSYQTYIATTLKNNANNLLLAYKSLIDQTQPRLQNLKFQLNDFKDSLTSNDNSSSLIYLINKMPENSVIKSNIDSFVNTFSDFTQELSFQENEENINFNDSQVINQLETQNQQEKDKYVEFIDKVYLNINNLVALVYGSEQDANNSLKQVSTQYITNRSEYQKLTKTVSKSTSSDPQVNFVLRDFIDDYQVLNENNNQSTSQEGQAVKQRANQMLDDAKQNYNIYSMLQNSIRLYKSAVTMKEWVTNLSNRLLLFNYLYTKTTDQNLNVYENVIALDTSQTEKFVEKVNALSETSKTQFVKNDVQYDQVLLNNQNEILDLFKTFSILKQQDSQQLFNLDNVKVYLYKKATDSKYIETFFQTDTSIKKAKLNLRFEYIRPGDIDPVFADVENFSLEFPDIFVTFKTKDEAKITKEFFESQETMKTKVIFNNTDAGFNAFTTIPNMLVAYNKYTFGHLNALNQTYFIEDVSKNIDDPDQGFSTSKEFKIKLKFKDDAVINFGGQAYIPIRDSSNNPINKIYWMPMQSSSDGFSTLNYKIIINLFVPMQKQNVSPTNEQEWKNRYALFNYQLILSNSVNTTKINDPQPIVVNSNRETYSQDEQGIVLQIRGVNTGNETYETIKKLKELPQNSNKEEWQIFTEWVATASTDQADRFLWTWGSPLMTDSPIAKDVNSNTSSGTVYYDISKLKEQIEVFDIKFKLH